VSQQKSSTQQDQSSLFLIKNINVKFPTPSTNPTPFSAPTVTSYWSAGAAACIGYRLSSEDAYPMSCVPIIVRNLNSQHWFQSPLISMPMVWTGGPFPICCPQFYILVQSSDGLNPGKPPFKIILRQAGVGSGMPLQIPLAGPYTVPPPGGFTLTLDLTATSGPTAGINLQ